VINAPTGDYPLRIEAQCRRSDQAIGRLTSVSERGCDYCADDANMYYGHVEQIGSSEALRKLLLRCPRCGWLYEASASGLRDAVHISASQAAERFTA
jgi:hypothetical protein